MVRVLVNGACGRMGQAVVKAVLEDEALTLAAAVDLKGGMDAGTLAGLSPCGVTVTVGLEAAIEAGKPDVMVDFTRPDAVFENALTALQKGVAPVIGTTGLSDDQKAALKKCSEETGTPAFIAPNFAIGAVLMMEMAQQAARSLSFITIRNWTLPPVRPSRRPNGSALCVPATPKGIRRKRRSSLGRGGRRLMASVSTASDCRGTSLIRKSFSAGWGRR